MHARMRDLSVAEVAELDLVIEDGKVAAGRAKVHAGASAAIAA